MLALNLHTEKVPARRQLTPSHHRIQRFHRASVVRVVPHIMADRLTATKPKFALDYPLVTNQSWPPGASPYPFVECAYSLTTSSSAGPSSPGLPLPTAPVVVVKIPEQLSATMFATIVADHGNRCNY
jgi:hypothetical protein